MDTKFSQNIAYQDVASFYMDLSDAIPEMKTNSVAVHLDGGIEQAIISGRGITLKLTKVSGSYKDVNVDFFARSSGLFEGLLKPKKREQNIIKEMHTNLVGFVANLPAVFQVNACYLRLMGSKEYSDSASFMVDLQKAVLASDSLETI